MGARMRQLVSSGAIALIADFEGFRENAYQDRGGVWTIGYGFTRIKGRPVQQGDVITQERAREVLRAQVLDFATRVDQMVPPSVGQIAFDALVSFAYNVGAAALQQSTLLVKLLAGDMQGAAAQFPRWNKSAGEVDPVLVNRRRVERALFLYGCAAQMKPATVDDVMGVGY